MTKPTIFIDGEAGTTGLQIKERLNGRTDIEIVSIDPARRKDENERRRLLNAVDLVVLCLPDDAAKQSVAMIDNPNVRVLDASTAHRTADGWIYGFPELAAGQREAIAAGKRVSNPGCYPTGMLALTRPLVDAGLLPAGFPVTINAISGYSGGGRQMIDAFEGRGDVAIDDAYRMYGLELAHKHVKEMQKYAGLSHPPLFSPAVGKFAQGMIVNLPLQLWLLEKKVSGRDLHEVLAAHFAGQKFVRVLPLEENPKALEPEALNGSNKLELFVFANDATGQALLSARLDNLGKGASGAAAQNIDLMLGLKGERDYAIA